MEQPSESVAQIARRYIQSGDHGGLETVVLASGCEALVRDESQRSLAEAFKVGRQFYLRTKRSEPALRLAACRAMARVAHVSARYSQAEKYYREIRTMVRDSATRARVDRALADVYMYLNRFDLSEKSARAAIATFRRLGMEADVAMTEVNFANMLHRQDKHKAAEKIYSRAAEYFEKHGDLAATARCYYNRANTLVQLFDFDTAEQLYTRAEEIYRQQGLELEANDARYGIAWLHMLHGQFHVALLDLSACEKTYQRIGQPKGAALCELDRAEVYLGLNLFEDAYDSAHVAETQFGRLKLRYEASKAALFRARAAFALGQRREMRLALRKAWHGFAADHNQGFLGAVTVLYSQTVRDRSGAQKAMVKARRHFGQAQLPLWEAACDLHIASLGRLHAKALIRLENNRAVHAVPYLYAQWQTLLGDKCADQGSLSLARLHWSRAADRLDAVRAQLPPIEFRTAFGQNGASPHKKLIAAELPERPRHAAAWSERIKTSGPWALPISLNHTDPARQRAEQSLIELANHAAHLWSSHQAPDGKRGARRNQSDLALRHMQKHVRLALAAMEQKKTTTVDSVDVLLESLYRVSATVPIVQFHIGDTELLAFVHEQGRTRVHRYPASPKVIEEYMLQWRFIMESQSLAQHFSESAELDGEEKLFRRIGEWLWKPLEISDQYERVLILPEGVLANLPWSAIIIEEHPLVEKHQFIVSPSLRHYLHASSQHSTGDAIELFAGNGFNLPQARQELLALAEMAGPRAVIHDPATRADWPTTGSAHIWHYAGHARLRADNPFYSFLALQDGPLFAADFRLRRVAVNLVTLAACRTGEQVASPGEEASGLVRSLLEMGARNVIAGCWPVADDSTALWMGVFYQDYLQNGRVLGAASVATEAVRRQYRSAFHWAAFAVFGAGS